MKAFFSHSHADAELVQAVARKVGRPYVEIDSITFRAADDLIGSMERAVRDSAIFVFFASRSSFASGWVNFELNEARYYQALTRIKKLLVVVLDDRIKLDEFPAWMSRSLFMQSRSAAPIARQVRRLVDEMTHGVQNPYFVGRAKETAELQSALVPAGTDYTPIVVIRGLPGIGRRTLLSRVVRDSLSLDRLLVVRVEVGDNVNSLTIKLADLIEPSATPADTLSMAREIESLSPDEAAKRFVFNLRQAIELNEMVVLCDEGGLLANDGELVPNLRAFLQYIANQADLLLAVVANRRPSWRDVPELSATPIVDVDPLAVPEAKQLLSFIARSHSVVLPLVEAGLLAEQVRGYPPAARAVVQIIKTYGLAAAVSVARRNTEFQPRPLTNYLKSLQLSAPEQKILSVLARNSPLPIDVVAKFAAGTDSAVESLVHLIDMSLVSPQEGTSWYRISEPIVEYVIRSLPPCSVDDYRIVANQLDEFLSRDQDSGQYLDLSRVFYRALIHAKREDGSPRAYALMADWLKLAEDFYHQRDYSSALEYATLAHETSPSMDALTWKIKCNTKLAEYTLAVEQIEDLRRLGQVREAHFLRGFIERSRADYREAVKYYELARQAGRGGVALERDLAECYFHIGNLERANEHISEAQRRQPDNRYIVDLRIKIACAQHDEAAARALLPLVDEVDSGVFAQHRRSMVELTFGQTEIAYEHAHRAVSLSERPPAESLANLANCEILLAKYLDASATLNRLEELYPKQRKDVLLSLRARLANAEGRYEDALGYCEQFVRKDVAAHIGIRRDAIQGLLSHTSMSSVQRKEKEHQVAELGSQLEQRFGRSDWQIETD